MRQTVFVHALRFEDYGGVTLDGARTGRQPVRKGRVAGFTEARPGRIVIEVVAVATPLARVQALAGRITPAVLLALAGERSFSMGESANRLVSLRFTDFSPSLALAETSRVVEDDVEYHTGRLVFHLEGFLHLLVTKQDGLGPRQPTPARPTPAPQPGPGRRPGGGRKAGRSRRG
jgi:hypothetical protein